MRFVAIALFVLAIPLVYGWMRGSVRNQRYVWIAIGFLPFVTGAWHLDASIISWAGWPGYVKGMLVSLLDAIAAAVLLAMPGRRGTTPFVWLIVGYLVAAALSIAASDIKMAAFFYAWQLARALLLFLAVSRIAMHSQGVRALIIGATIGAVLQAGYSLNERLHGVVQAHGTLGHQNLLGMAMHFVLYPALALLLARPSERLAQVGFGAALIAVVLTGSRATIGLAGVGIVALVLMSLVRRSSGRKIGIAVAGLLAVAVASPIAYQSIESRFQNNSADGSDEERLAFERAAKMILADHPMGIGANQYIVVANTAGYSARAGVIWNYSSRATNVHNTYLLVASETGYLGLVTFVALMILPIFAAMRFAWADRRDPRGDLMLGFAVTLAVVAAHCEFEWIFVTYVIQYLFAMCLGMVAGLIRQRRAERTVVNPRRQRPVLDPTGLPALGT